MWLPQIIALLCAAKVLDPELYAKLRKSSATFEQVDEFACFKDWRTHHNRTERTPQSDRAEKMFAFAFGVLNDPQVIREISGALFHINMSPGEIIPYYCNLADGFSFPLAG